MVASLAAAEEIIQDTAIAAFLSKSGGIKLIKHQNNLVFLMSYTCLVSLKKKQFLKFRYLKKKNQTSSWFLPSDIRAFFSRVNTHEISTGPDSFSSFNNEAHADWPH